MKRRELRQHIFELLFRVEFNPAGEMEEQLTLFFEALKGEREITEQDEAYIREKYEHYVTDEEVSYLAVHIKRVHV